MNRTEWGSVFKRTKRNFRAVPHLHVAATSTVVFSLLIAGMFLILYANVNDLIDAWKQDFRVIAYVKKGLPPAEGESLVKTITEMEGIRGAVYVSEDQALSRLKKQMKHRSSLLEGLRENPLPPSVEIELARSDPDEVQVREIVQRLRAVPEIESVEYARAWLHRFSGFVTFFRLATVVGGGIIFATTVFICSNTIRLTLYARRQELEVMKIIGATDGFIKMPYYLQNFVEGLLGSVLAVGILYGAYGIFTTKLAAHHTLLSAGNIRFLSLWEMTGLIGGGISMAWLGCHLSLRQFTKS
jgi:cell division transport system permease protein